MKFDFKKLEKEIEEATRKAFQEIVANHASEKIYAFALYSDEGAMTVCPSTNTEDFLATNDQEDLTYYKFEPAEWQYEGDGAEDEFSKISTQLYDITEVELENEDDEVFEAFQQELYQTCIQVLLKLKKENFFRNLIGKDIFLMFSVTDYEYDRDKLKEMIISLNDNVYQQEYLDWMKTWRN
ncbi:DUF4303 domain-containing protein [Empedobacter brevis]|uniref:DUF4303 domain-containing protein n=1 Tax=Empedobacter brevis TaxID=247 RepID=UPI0039B0D640